MVHLISLRALLSFAVTTVVVFSVFSYSASAQPLGPGDLYPDFSHTNDLGTPACDYLGIEAAARLNLGLIKQDSIILENKYSALSEEHYTYNQNKIFLH